MTISGGVDPRALGSSIRRPKRSSVLRLNAQGYVEHAQCRRRQQAVSVEFEGIVVDVGRVFDAGQGEQKEA